MTETEMSILAALVDLETAVASMRESGTRHDLMPLFKQLDELAGRLGSEADPELKHYLQRKSYEKARLHLEGRKAEITQGRCG